jgi:hypothetical protein
MVNDVKASEAVVAVTLLIFAYLFILIPSKDSSKHSSSCFWDCRVPFLHGMQLIGKKLVGFSLHGVPSARRQIIKNANSETNFWYARNSKKEKKKDDNKDNDSVKSELFNFF